MNRSFDWVLWAPLCAAVLHISEEFVFPGGFTAWYRTYRADASRITVRFLVIVNAALLLACANIIALGRTGTGVAFWLTIAALMCSNAIWHAFATVKSGTYSPGLVTGLGLYVPLALYGFAHFLRSGAASAGTAVFAALIGGSYHLWSARYHRAKS